MATRVLSLLLLLLFVGEASALTPESDHGVNEHLVARAVWISPHVFDISYETLTGSTPQAADPWIGPDKLMHFSATFLLTLSGQYFLENKMRLEDLRAVPVAAGTAFALGLFKELADSQRQHRPLFSWRDMAWNSAGIAAAVIVILA